MARAQHDASGIESGPQEARLFSPRHPEQVGGPVAHPAPWRVPRLHARSIDDPRASGRRGPPAPLVPHLDRVLDWDPPDARWFIGDGRTSARAVDRHVAAGRTSELAILWEGEPIGHGAPRSAAHLRPPREGLPLRQRPTDWASAGDVVTIYMGMVPSWPSPCSHARIGGSTSVIFEILQPGHRRSRPRRTLPHHRRAMALAARRSSPSRRTPTPPSQPSPPTDTPSTTSSSSIAAACAPSGPTGATATGTSPPPPPGQTARASPWTARMSPSCSTPRAPRASPRASSTPSADTWSTPPSPPATSSTSYPAPASSPGVPPTPAGSRVTPTSSTASFPAASTLMYEAHERLPRTASGPSSPATASPTSTPPTAIRAFMKWGSQHPAAHDLTSLQVLGSVGEPINRRPGCRTTPYRTQRHAHIVDTWWQTETGGHMIRPSRASRPPSPDHARSPSSASTPPSWTSSAANAPQTREGSWASAAHGPPCSAPSTATAHGSSRPTSRSSSSRTPSP